MTGWPQSDGQFRSEIHFGNRSVSCLADRPTSLIDMLNRSAAAHPTSEALVCGNFRCDWGSLASLTDAFASGLTARGVSQGDRVILFLGNRAEFVIALLAILRIGAVAVPVGTREQSPGLAYIAMQSGASAILYEAGREDIIPELPLTVEIGEQEVTGFVSRFSGDRAALLPVLARDEDPALIMYTSGTTGRPKGAIITGLALVHVAAAYAQCMELGHADRSACVVPLSHITGITAALATMAFAGGCLIVVPEFKAQEFVELAVRERMSHTLLVPAMYNLILARVELGDHDLAAWRIGAFGGAPMPVPTIETLNRQLPGLQLMNCYGATETCGAVTIMPSRYTSARSGSVGWPVPGMEIRIMDSEGREVPAGESGELWIAGATVSPGYWCNPEATADNFIGGFWRSGDIGHIDQEGFVHILDRLKDMINRGGYKIFTAEVESILMAHPAVLEAAVVAKPCPVLGERVHAFISLRPEAESIGDTQLREYCSSRMTDYKQPESYSIQREPLPRNLNGKIVKNELRAWLGI